MSRIIIVNGYPGVGKDTFVNYTISELKNQGYSAISLSSVDKVKEAAVLLGWDNQKDDRGRDFLSSLKDMSVDYYNGPYRYIKETLSKKEYLFYFIHIREPKEIRKIKENFDAIALLIDSHRGLTHLTNTGDSDVLNVQYDITIPNNGTLLELQKRAKNFAESLYLGLTAECYL
jgi:hypothetical protein